MFEPPQLALVAALVAALPYPAPAQDVRVQSHKVAGNVWMLTGQGGNIGVQVGDDGIILVDDQFAPLADQIKAAVAKLCDGKIRFVINTHWHGDHTGGNARFGKTGALIVAHENVRKRMSTEQFIKAFGNRVKPSPKAALPVVTFTDKASLHFNADELRIIHMQPAHTDGDSVVWFKKADVVHMGDTFFNKMYPFIDTSSHGNIMGVIKAADRVLGFAGDKTKIIPGHGPLGDKKDLVAYRDMLATVAGRVDTLVAAGKTRAEVIAAKPTKDYDAAWGNGFMKPDVWTGIVYDGIKVWRAASKPAKR